MFLESFEKTAGFVKSFKRLAGKAPEVGSGLLKSREHSIMTGAGRAAEKLKSKTFTENVGGVSRGSLLSGERAKLKKNTTQDVKDRARKVFGGEGKPTWLGRQVAKHPIVAGVGTYAAGKAAFGEKKDDQSGPSVSYASNGNY